MKKWVALLLTIIMVVALTACEGNGNNTNVGDYTNPSQNQNGENIIVNDSNINLPIVGKIEGSLQKAGKTEITIKLPTISVANSSKLSAMFFIPVFAR